MRKKECIPLAIFLFVWAYTYGGPRVDLRSMRRQREFFRRGQITYQKLAIVGEDTQLSQQESFMRLFVAHQPRIYALIRSMVFNRHDAEEILQDVVTVLWRRFDEFEPGTHFDRWALQVAFNQVRSYRRRKSRSGFVFDDDLADVIADEAEALHAQLDEFRDALAFCLGKLEPRDQELLRQRFQPGATNRDVARQVKRSESAVSRGLNRIYRLLLECIRSQEKADFQA